MPEVRNIVNDFESTGLLVTRAQKAVNVDTLPKSLQEIHECYSTLLDELTNAESSHYTISDAYERAYKFDFSFDPAGIQKYLDRRLKENVDLVAIMEMSRPEISPALYSSLKRCQATSTSVERTFSMLGKLLSKDRQFHTDNICKYLSIYVNKPDSQE